MNPNDVAKQGQIENQMLKHLIEGIRSTIAWKVTNTDVARKVSTLRFIAQSFQRHLARLMTLEEYDGYMSLVVDSCPRLAKTVELLRSEHDRFRVRVDRVVHDLERLHPDNDLRLRRICDDFLALLEKLDEHTRLETDVLQEAMDRDTGGEG